jgi:hypothetical protein
MKERPGLDVYLNVVNVIFVLNDLVNGYNMFKSFVKIVNSFKK